ncbi:MAG: DUF368 domain-containing protein [Lachnospiraceae bacterium]|nr:DUF368 domain-containing protein [Lachnospiraceae bacterium]
MQFFIRLFQGVFIGLGAVLPGISGGVLCVIFGIYKTIMELLAKPFHNFRTHVPKLIPVGLGGIIGFLGIANVLSVLLERYPEPSVCLFVGLIGGMLPTLYREAGEQGRQYASYVSMYVSMILVFSLLVALQVLKVVITPSFGWYVFCGFCLALSVIAPGMSFSTLLMPLGLYEPFVAGIGHMDLGVLIPGGLGTLATVILFSKAVSILFQKHYSVAFHAIVGVVIAATIMIIPFKSFVESSVSFIVNILCLTVGIMAAVLLDRFNKKYDVEKSV